MVWLLLIGIWLLVWGVAWNAFRRGRLRTPWHRDIAALFLLALATLGCFWRVTTGQNWMPADGGDLVSFLFPIYRFAATSLITGDWPLWNPHLYGGAPHVGDIQAGFLYPPNLLLFLLKPDFPYAALQWLSMAHIWFAGAGAYLFLAHGQRVRRLAALAGALTFMFSDGFFVHFGNLNYNAVMSWLPWVFWAYTASERMGESANQRIGESANQRISESANHEFVTRHSSFVIRYSPFTIRYSPFAIRHSLFAIRHSVLAGVLLAIGSLAGHIQATLFIALALAFYSALWLFLERDEPAAGRRAAEIALRLAVCGLIAAVLTAPILLPAFELWGRTARVAWNYQQTAGYSLAPAQWIGWLIPGFFGRGPQFHWGLWPRVESGYVGILPLILAGLAIALRRERGERRVWLWAGVALASFLLALGIYAIPHGWLTLVPPFGQLRAPGRLVMITGFALAMLAAFGLDAGLRTFDEQMAAAWRRVRRGLGRLTAAVWLIIVPLGYLALLLTQDRPPEMVSRISVTLIAIMSFAGLLTASLLWMIARGNDWARPTTLGWLAVGLIFLDLTSLAAYQDLGNRDPSLSYQQERIVAFLKQQPGPFRIDTKTDIQKEWQPDTALLYGLEDIDGIANPLLLADVGRYWDNLGSRSTPLYDLLNIRYVIARKDAPFDWSKFVLAFDGDPRLNVYENKNALPRAFFVPQIQVVADHEAAWAAIHAPGFDPRVTAVVEAASNLQVAAGGQVMDIRPGPNRLILQVTATGPAFLVISQVWYPGWEVWLDGRLAAPPLRTDYLFQGVAVPEGAHRIELRFAPRGWRVGWWLAAAGLAAMTFGALMTWRSCRRKCSNDDEVNDAD